MTTEIKGALVMAIDILKQDINWAETIGQRYSTEILNKERVLEQLQAVIDAVPDDLNQHFMLMAKGDTVSASIVKDAAKLLHQITQEDNDGLE
jgi:hypothetical protein